MTRPTPTADRPAATDPVVPEFDEALPITEDDGAIASAVADAELPALLAALAMLVGDPDLIADDLRPPIPLMAATIAPQGGMSEAAQARGRELATRALSGYRDRGCPPIELPDQEFLARIMRFLTKDAGAEHLPLLRHELALPADVGAPGWHRADLAPGVAFTVAVVGAGIAGLAAAHRLAQAGVEVVVFEKNDEVGGTWWENDYPGCRLDTPNFAYSYSFAQKPDWPQQFSERGEIQRYLARVATGTGVRARIRFGTEVTALTYDEDAQHWRVEVRDRNGRERAHVVQAVITAVGQLNRPQLPDITGRETFAGPAFHSARWDHDVDLTGRRVAVVGTGASAYQVVPAIVDRVAELKIFQRHPPWMLPTPTYHHDIRPGMTWLLRHVPYYGRWFRFWQFWIAVEGRLPFVEVDDGWEHPVSVGARNEQLRQECVEHLERQLADRPDLLVKTLPDYPPGAKRMLRDNGVWAAALRRDHVDLVTDPIVAVGPEGISTADGRDHPLDVIVYATGFTAADYLAPIRVIGAGGRDLHRWWAGDARAHLGITVPGFPNLFLTAGPNTAVVVNGSAIFSAECAAEYAVAAIGMLLARGARSMEVREEPFRRYNAWVDAGNLRKAWGAARVSSWYKNASGRASQTWPFTLSEYWRLTETPDLAEYIVR